MKLKGKQITSPVWCNDCGLEWTHDLGQYRCPKCSSENIGRKKMKLITRDIVKRNKDILFIFGDNDLRYGLGGFAKACRSEPNSLGIRVKKKPDMTEDSFYIDAELEENKVKIDEDFNKLKQEYKHYSAAYIPDGIGAGLARMPEKAPKTYNYLRLKIREFNDKFNDIKDKTLI